MKTEIQPVKSSDRIEILDIIRGFAIMGILIANIQSWSGYKFIPFDMLRVLDFYEYNSIAKNLFMIFIDTKFYAIFSMLFGIGFFLQFNKFRDNQDDFIKTYRRRLGILIIFGAFHAFFWSGDILLIYALVGFIFILFRNLENRELLKWSIIFYYIWLIKDVITALFFPDLMQHHLSAYKTYMDMSPEGVTFFFQHGTIMEVLNTNWHNLAWRYFDLLPAGRLSKILALFLFGYYLMSIGYFKNLVYSKKLLTVYIVAGLFFTIASNMIGGSMSTFSSSFSDILYKILAVTGQILMAMSYISILVYTSASFGQHVGAHSFSNVGAHSLSPSELHPVILIRSSDG